jgi:hypothetical protein
MLRMIRSYLPIAAAIGSLFLFLLSLESRVSALETDSTWIRRSLERIETKLDQIYASQHR